MAAGGMGAGGMAAGGMAAGGMAAGGVDGVSAWVSRPSITWSGIGTLLEAKNIAEVLTGSKTAGRSISKEKQNFKTLRSVQILIWDPFAFWNFWKKIFFIPLQPNVKKNKTSSKFQYTVQILKVRVADPNLYPHGSAFKWGSGSGSRRAKWPTKLQKRPEFPCFEVLDVLFWGLKASSVAWTSFM
jgi:hypothetical protein